MIYRVLDRGKERDGRESGFFQYMEFLMTRHLYIQ